MAAAVRGYLATSDGSLVYELEDEETHLGRAEGNDIVLGTSRSISSRHCRLVVPEAGVRRGGWRARLYDLESLNGTFLNDTRIHNAHAELRSGDSLRLGYDPTIYRFYLTGEEPADLMGPVSAAPRRGGGVGGAQDGGGSGQAPQRSAGRATNWDGSGAGRSPLRDYDVGGSPGRRSGGEGVRDAYSHHGGGGGSSLPAGISSAEAARRRGSFGGASVASPTVGRGREGRASQGVTEAMGQSRYGGGRDAHLGAPAQQRHASSPQGRLEERRRSLSASYARSNMGSTAGISPVRPRQPVSPSHRGAGPARTTMPFPGSSSSSSGRAETQGGT